MNSTDMSGKTDQELADEQDAIDRELTRRRRVASGPMNAEMVIQEYQWAVGRENGDEWVQPVEACDGYLEGAVVTHDGALKRNTRRFNMCPPDPAYGWELVEQPQQPASPNEPPVESEES